MTKPELIARRALPLVRTGCQGRALVPSRVSRSSPPLVTQTVRPLSPAVSSTCGAHAPPVDGADADGDTLPLSPPPLSPPLWEPQAARSTAAAAMATGVVRRMGTAFLPWRADR